MKWPWSRENYRKWWSEESKIQESPNSPKETINIPESDSETEENENRPESDSETEEIENRNENRTEDRNYFTTEIHFNDGEILKLNARLYENKNGSFVFFSSVDNMGEGDDIILEIPTSSVKYCLTSEMLLMTPNIRYGIIENIKPAKKKRNKPTKPNTKNKLQEIE